MLGRFYIGQGNTESEREEEESARENENLSVRSVRTGMFRLCHSSETRVAFPRVVLGLDPRLCVCVCVCVCVSSLGPREKKERG